MFGARFPFIRCCLRAVGRRLIAGLVPVFSATALFYRPLLASLTCWLGSGPGCVFRLCSETSSTSGFWPVSCFMNGPCSVAPSAFIGPSLPGVIF